MVRSASPMKRVERGGRPTIWGISQGESGRTSVLRSLIMLP